MKQDYTPILNMAYDYMMDDITYQVKLRIQEEDNIVSIHVALASYIRNKYLWHHHEYCNYLADKFCLVSVHPDSISQKIVDNVYKQLKSKTDE